MILGIVLCCMAALLPAVLLYFPNRAEIPLAGMLPYFAILFGIGLLAWAGMYLITRRKGLAAMAAALWLLVLLNVGRIVPPLHEVFPLLGAKVIVPVTLLLLAAATFGLSRLTEDFLQDAVKVTALALAAFLLTSAVPSFFQASGPQEEEPAPVSGFDLTPAEGTDRPDIYWILSDEYAGLDELNKYYHYDNSPFYDTLREMGFTVSEHSYNWSSDTYAILRDILNLDYTGNRGRKREEIVADANAPLWTLLRNLGYQVCEAESTNKFRLINRLKEEVTDDSPRTRDGDAVANLLLQYSILYRYEDEVLQLVYPPLSATSRKDTVLNVLDWAEDPGHLRREDPSFTVIYMESPHAPFFFDRDGNLVPEEHQTDITDKKYYLDQLIYITKRLGNICGAILEADPDAIIVLQSDHGHRYVANITQLDQTNVLNAVYFRGKPISGIEDKNALNTWRAVLREQFGLDLPEVSEKRMKNEYRKDQRDPEAEDPNAELPDR